MPRYNRLADWSAGIGGGDDLHPVNALCNGRVIDPGPGGAGDWLNDDEFVCLRGGYQQLHAIHKVTGSHRILADIGPAMMGAAWAGGGRAAYRRADTGTHHFIDGTPIPYPVLGFGQDGSLATWAHPYNGSGLILNDQILLPASSDEEVVAHRGNVVSDLCILDSTHAVWRIWGVPYSIGLPIPKLLPGISYGLRATIDESGQPWIQYQASEWNGQLVLHPFDSFLGYALTKPGADAYRPDLVCYNGIKHSIWATVEGEHLGQIEEAIILREIPIDLAIRPIQIPVISRPLWMGWFTFIDGGPQTQPGNCLIPIIWPQISQDLFLVSKTVEVIAQYVAAEAEGTTIALENKIASASFHPTLCYLTPGKSIPRNAEWIGVEAYRHTNETIAQFTNRINQTIAACGSHPVILIAQCYTSNAANDSDLLALIPVYANLIIQHLTIIGIMIFSAGARATGWRDHPEVQDAWRQFFSGITGIPAIIPPKPPVPPIPPKPPTPPKPPLPSVVVQQKGDWFMSTLFTDPTKEILVVKELRPVPGTKAVTAINPNGKVWSIDEHGFVIEQDDNWDAGHERCQPNGNVLVYQPEGNGIYVVKPFVMVDAI